MRILPLLFFLLLLIPLTNFASAKEPFAQFINLQIDPVDGTTAEIEPTKEHTFYFKFYNGGSMKTNLYLFYVEFRVEVEGEGWEAYVSPRWTFFWPNETKIGKVRVAASARPSNYATVHLYGRLRDIYGNWHYGNFTFQVKAAQYHSFDVRLNQTFIKGRQEEIYTVPVKIINYGNYEDRFYINTVYAPQRWKVALSQSPIIIPPRGEVTVYMYFAIPHEGVYVQERTSFIMLEVKSEAAATSKTVAVIVAVSGFHLTLGQIVALLSSMPSLLLLAFIGVVIHRRNNPFTYLPKPWKEEGEEIAKLGLPQRRKILKEMKEEWKSAKYFLKWEIKDKRKLEKLRRLKEVKQKKLEEKIRTEWSSAWMPVYNKWKEECEKIKREYEKMSNKLKEKINRARKMGIKIDISLPELKYPPEPKKPSMPKIPEYRLDERRLVLIEPDEIEIERILAPVRKNKILAKRDAARIEEMSKEIMEKMVKSFETIEKKIDAEITKARKEMEKRRITMRREKEKEEMRKKFKK